jgi:protein-L-isoaspartate(D-aspartate) O-methyltransferase
MAMLDRGRAMTKEKRERMVSEQLRRRDIVDPAVLAAFEQVPRDMFVDPEAEKWAYEDSPLAIGYGQTISQPYVVAMTVQALRLTGNEKVLEIGTGSGYAAAILGRVAREVHTVERIGELAATATERLLRLGYTNVHVHHADGTLGWPANAPYEAIAVAAGAPRPPPSLLQQLTIGGRIVIPHGDASSQRLARITRKDERTFVEENLGEVRFVPLLGAEGWPVHHH